LEEADESELWQALRRIFVASNLTARRTER
jgi:hypothetical protein